MSKNITILYVEDEEIIRENTARPLSYLCDKLIVAKDGQEGLALYKQHNPDIVVSDIKMPNMNGIDMTKAIKDINEDQHIIFTTAHSENSFFMEAIELQVDGYILKPIDYDLLENKINKIIKQININQKLQEQEILTNEISKLQDNLLIVLDEKQNMIFSNDKFLDFFRVSSIYEFTKKHNNLVYLFLENKDFFTPNNKIDKNWIDEIKCLEDNKRIISMLDLNSFEPKAFLVSVKTIDKSKHTIVIFTEITNITIEKKVFEIKAFTDELTGIYNRAYFNEELAKEIARYKREKTPLCFFILDIDKFKDFNDTYGHLIGDEVLKYLAKVITNHARDTDTFARWGGEEFVMILPNTTLDGAYNVAEHLRKIIQNHTFVDGLRVTCSFGVSLFNEKDTQDTLMKRADDALYKAKESGRNMVVIEYK